jgi:hypothetical protein
MTILLVSNLIVGFGLGVFQLLVLAECGAIHRRLGKISHPSKAKESDLGILIGMKSILPPLTKALFVSLSCSSCTRILRGLADDTDIQIYVADQNDPKQVANLQSLYPEFRFDALPGEDVYRYLKVNVLPIFLETDADSIIVSAQKVQ